MNIASWNEIEKAFTDKFGWDKGIEYMLSISRDYLKYGSVEEMESHEEHNLKRALRLKYNKEKKCQENEKQK